MAHADHQKLKRALTEVNATPLQCRMANILLTINGFGNAMGFVANLKKECQLELFNY